MNDVQIASELSVGGGGVNPKELTGLINDGNLGGGPMLSFNNLSPGETLLSVGGGGFEDPLNGSAYNIMAIPNSGNAEGFLSSGNIDGGFSQMPNFALDSNYSSSINYSSSSNSYTPLQQISFNGNSPYGSQQGLIQGHHASMANVPYLNQGMDFSSSGTDLTTMWPSKQQHQQQQLNSMVNPMHVMYHPGMLNPGMSSYMMNPVAPNFVTNNSMMTIKVPMVPWRTGSTISLSEDKPMAPLMLPFHHKNDNSIIPQTFGSGGGLGGHGLGSTMMSHYSVEELQHSKDLFIGKAGSLDFTNITVVELKNFLKDFGLAPGGKKDDLIARIKQIKDYLISEQKGLLASNTVGSGLSTENPFIIYGSNSFFPPPTTTTMM